MKISTGLFALLIALVAASAQAQVRMVSVDVATQNVTLRNFGAGNVDISGYFMCRSPGTYRIMSSLPIVSGGDLSLDPGEEVTITYGFVDPAGGVGLYRNGSGFGNAVNLADYVQWVGVSGFREGVAVTAGIWTAGTFASGAGPVFEYTGDGIQDGATFWATAAAVPALPIAFVLGLAGALAIGGGWAQRRRVPARA